MMVLNSELKSRNSIRRSVVLLICKTQSGVDGILSGAVWLVDKLEGVKCGRESGEDVLLYQPLKALYITLQRE